MITSLDKQGSAARYSVTLTAFQKAILSTSQHVPGPRELERGVTQTADNKGEKLFFKLKADIHVPALRVEAFARQLGTQEELGKLKYRALCYIIKEQIKEKWIVDHPGKSFDTEVEVSSIVYSPIYRAAAIGRHAAQGTLIIAVRFACRPENPPGRRHHARRRATGSGFRSHPSQGLGFHSLAEWFRSAAPASPWTTNTNENDLRRNFKNQRV
eukprot:scaffold41484_cov97-Attheya_sp.AAC.2